MDQKLLQILAGLYRRPERERRALGIALFLILAAVVILIGMMSLRKSLSLLEGGAGISAENNAEQNAGTTKGRAKNKGPELTAPFSVLKGSLAEISKDLKDIVAGVKSLSRGVPEATEEKQNEVQSPAPALSRALPLPLDHAEEALVSEKGKTSKAESAGGADKQKNVSDAKNENQLRLSDILKNGVTENKTYAFMPQLVFTRKQADDNQNRNEFSGLLEYNFGELRRAASDFYQYLTQ